jgi:hypothetical protein
MLIEINGKAELVHQLGKQHSRMLVMEKQHLALHGVLHT